MNYLRLLGWCMLFALTGPLWIVGMALAFIWGRLVAPLVVGILRHGFEYPCFYVLRQMLWQFKVTYRPTPEVEAAEKFRRRARRARRGG